MSQKKGKKRGIRFLQESFMPQICTYFRSWKAFWTSAKCWCFVCSKSQRTWGSKVHTSLKSDVEVWDSGGVQNTFGQTVIPPIFIAALMLFILKTFLFLRPVTAVALKFCLCASFILNLHTIASQSQTQNNHRWYFYTADILCQSLRMWAAKENSVFYSWQAGKASETRH